MSKPTPWLPDSILASYEISTLFAGMAESWSRDWLANETWQAIGVWVRTSGPDSADYSPIRTRSHCAISTTHDASRKLADALLGRDRWHASSELDQRLVQHVVDRAIDNLMDRFCGLFKTDESISSVPLADPYEFSLPIGRVGDTPISLECTCTALTNFARNAFDAAPALPDLVSIDEACKNIGVSVSGSLGSTRVSILQLTDMAPGDLFVLDTPARDTCRLMVDRKTTSMIGKVGVQNSKSVIEFQGSL